MPRTKTLTGKPSDTSPQSCEPLHGLLGLDLCSEFMTMYDVLLSNGHTARVFKHRLTRAYIHLDTAEPGLAYEYCGNDRYRTMPLGAALLRTFSVPDPSDRYFED